MRFFIAFLVTIGLIVLILVLLLGGGGGKKPILQKPLNVSDYSTTSGSYARVVVEGPIVANQNYNEYQIDVSEDTITLTAYQGYQQSVIRTQTYANNQTAYDLFLRGLQLSGYTLHNTTKFPSDERGYCVQGDRTIYSFYDGNTQRMRYWHASCGQGTFEGNISVVNFLFDNQVPDFSKLVNGLNV